MPDSGTDTDNAPDPTVPLASDIPAPEELCEAGEATTGCVVWHRKHLRTEDHRALATAVAENDVVCPLFVFDPTFYRDGGLACDARIRFLHEAVTSLDRLYGATPVDAVDTTAQASIDRLDETAVSLQTAADTARTGALKTSDTPGLTVGYGDPVTLSSRFVDRGWSVVTMATPTSRYGYRRDEQVRQRCGDAVTFVSGDGLVRNEEWPRSEWQSRAESWLTGDQQEPSFTESETARVAIDTGVTPACVDDAFDITPAKEQVPTGTHRKATTRLRTFINNIRSYPDNISAPQAARDGTSGLSPYLNFGLLSVRQVYQYVTDNAPACRGRNMYIDRLYWNLHYNQKLADWPGWTDRAVNPVLAGFNEDTHDPTLVDAWKDGQTGFPMVDAAMRCLRRTGWLNFRMRAMCSSFFTHILQQPWWIGADWYHHHLIDSDAGINYTQWQSQAGLIGKPSQRVYNPRKQVRDHDPTGEWITKWVPELSPLPAEFLDRPERAPLSVQADCGVQVGNEYPYPVVDFEARRETFWDRYERHRPAAAQALGRPEIAKRASFSSGYDGAQAIAAEYGPDEDASEAPTQASLTDAVATAVDPDTESGSVEPAPADESARPDSAAPDDAAHEDGKTTVPTGTGTRAGEPSPDDHAAVGAQSSDNTAETAGSNTEPPADEQEAEQTTIEQFD